MFKVVKIGGNVIDNPAKLDKFLEGFALTEGPKILVHGGGKIASEVSKKLGIEPVMIDGRRVTDKATLDVVTGVYAGLINKNIVNKLNAAGCTAVGLSGADGIIRSRKRPAEPVDYGFVGDPVEVRTDLLELLAREGFSVVLAPITAEGKGSLLNTNADTVAQAIAVAMSAILPVELIFCFEKEGVLLDPDDDDSAIKEIHSSDLEKLKTGGIISGGMLPKLENAFKAIGDGVSRVVICSSDAVAAGREGGTVITK